MPRIHRRPAPIVPTIQVSGHTAPMVHGMAAT